MSVNSEKDIVAIRKVCNVVAHVLWEMINFIKPGTTTQKLDEIGEKVMKQFGAKSAPKYFHNFPGNTCISVNEIIAHGIPNKRILRCGDFVNIDVSAELNGFFGDVGYSLVLREYNYELDKLCQCAKTATLKAISKCVAGTTVNEIGKVVEDEARSKGYTVIKNLCSHGIGRTLHAHPKNILNYFDPEETNILESGMVIAFEPYISNGACRAMELSDGWTLTTHNNSRVAQFEHTVLVTDGKPEILTVL